MVCIILSLSWLARTSHPPDSRYHAQRRDPGASKPGCRKLDEKIPHNAEARRRSFGLDRWINDCRDISAAGRKTQWACRSNLHTCDDDCDSADLALVVAA